MFNKHHGFLAVDCGALDAKDDCTAQNNGGGGFVCKGKGSVLRAAKECWTGSNELKGFLEKEGGQIVRQVEEEAATPVGDVHTTSPETASAKV
jgi:hypothetical protein